MYHVLCCGSNGAGQLGLGHEEDIFKLTESFQSESKVIKIACGSNHTIILLENGDLYACGNNTNHLVNFQRNNEVESETETPYNPIIESLHTFKRVGDGSIKFKYCGAGWDFTILVDEFNKVYIYGDLKQCGGLGNDVLMTSKLSEVYQAENDQVISVNVSLHSTIIIHQSGKIITWGNNKKGQILGNDEKPSILWKPTNFYFRDIDIGKEGDLKIIRCAMGRDYTFFHVIHKLTNVEYLIMRSKNDRLNILQELQEIIGESPIIGNIENIRTRWFTIKQNIKIHQLESMWSSIHIMYSTSDTDTDNNNNNNNNNKNKIIRSFGNNVFNQIFPGFREPIDSFVVGTEHGIGITQDKKSAFAWGWGEHGNCGHQKNLTELNELYFCKEGNQFIDSMFGGYATTWIVVKT
ncbi:hypothetical protein C6P42_000041 [Pichia californica]|nr:hypothetical protein C6P42_000041 [[Candida] californica]